MDAKYLAEIKARVEKDIPDIAAPVFRDRHDLIAEVERLNEACETACATAREYCDKLMIAEKQIATLKKALEIASEEVNKAFETLESHHVITMTQKASGIQENVDTWIQQAQEQEGKE